MDKNHIGLCLLQHIFNAQQNIGGNGGQGLAGTHDVQVVICGDAEDLSDLVQHLAVLTGETYDALDFRVLLQLLHQGAHFEGFGTGAEDAHNLKFCCSHLLHLL